MFNTLNITVTHAVYITQVEHKNRAIIFSMDNAASTIETAAFLNRAYCVLTRVPFPSVTVVSVPDVTR